MVVFELEGDLTWPTAPSAEALAVQTNLEDNTLEIAELPEKPEALHQPEEPSGSAQPQKSPPQISTPLEQPEGISLGFHSTSTLEFPFVTAIIPDPEVEKFLPDDVVVVLLGVSGAGKSSFIQRVTRREIAIGEGLTSGDTKFVLVDTPGLNDPSVNDPKILDQVVHFLEERCRRKTKVTAIIYLHPIIKDSLEGSAPLANVSPFQTLCDPDFYPNIMLGTTFWDQVDLEDGKRREADLKETEEFWGAMIRRGSQAVRIPNGRSSCIELLMKLVSKDQEALKVRQELVDEGKQVVSRTATPSEISGGHDSISLETTDDDHNRKIVNLEWSDFAKMTAQEEDLLAKQIWPQDGEMDQSIRERREQLEEAERMQEAALREREELRRRAEKEAERTQQELEKLKLEAAVKEEPHRIGTLEAHAKRRVALLTSAVAMGKVKINAMYSSSFLNLDVGSYCNHCRMVCSGQLWYRCNICGNFDICSPCYDKGRRCQNNSHKTHPRRSLVGTEAGNCRRTLRPPHARFRIPCNSCKKFINSNTHGSVYFHCCLCDSDNYDLCFDCVIMGHTCPDPSHLLQVMAA